MVKARDVPTFDQWRDYLFHRTRLSAFCDPDEDDYTKKESILKRIPLTDYMTRLFEKSGSLIERYSPNELARGFEDLSRARRGGLERALRVADSHKRQIRLIKSIFPLYRDLFAKLCTQPILDADGKCIPKGKLEYQCTTFWWGSDVWRAATSPSATHLHDATFETLERILGLNSSDCLEAALYALKEIRPTQPERVHQIATDFLTRKEGIETCIRERAKKLLDAEQPDSPDLDFDEWIKYVFDRPIQEESWYWLKDENGEYLDRWQPHPVSLAEHMARLFEQPAFLAERFSSEQIDQGFWFLPHGEWDHYKYALRDEIPLETQLRWVRAIPNLYRNLFAPLCSPHMGSQPINQDLPENPLNGACYMFWDMNDLYALVSSFWHRHVWPDALRALEQILEIDSIPCQESALHGLGHLYKTIPDQVQSIIRRFPQTGKKLHPALQGYAEAAGKGWVQ